MEQVKKKKNTYNNNNNDDNKAKTSQTNNGNFMKTKVTALSLPLGLPMPALWKYTHREFIIKEKFISFNKREMKR